MSVFNCLRAIFRPVHPYEELTVSTSYTTIVPYLPPECLLMIFHFFQPYEEFPLAMVCREWYYLLREKRVKRVHQKWFTWIGCVVNTVSRLQWAKQKARLPWNGSVCMLAARCGHLETLQWARRNKCPWNSSTCTAAAWKGHLHILQWARKNKCPWNADTYRKAARGGHLEVLKWAYENGCPWRNDVWDQSVAVNAVEKGHVHVLQWWLPTTRYNGKWHLDSGSEARYLDILLWVAIEKGHLHAVEYLHGLLLQYAPDSIARKTSCVAKASKEGHLHILKWLREHGYPWDGTTIAGAKTDEIRRWAIENGCPMGMAAV